MRKATSLANFWGLADGRNKKAFERLGGKEKGPCKGAQRTLLQTGQVTNQVRPLAGVWAQEIKSENRA